MRVGCGPYVASKVFQDVAEPLRGKEQTVQKGELVAAAHALCVSPCRLVTHADNSYVVRIENHSFRLTPI